MSTKLKPNFKYLDGMFVVVLLCVLSSFAVYSSNLIYRPSQSNSEQSVRWQDVQAPNQLRFIAHPTSNNPDTEFPIHIALTSYSVDLTEVQQCVVEAACRNVPSSSVTLYHSGYLKIDQLKSRLEGIGACKPSQLHFKKLDYQDLFEHTPLMRWYDSGVWKKGFSVSNLSNAIRLATVYKYGGAYIDIDLIILKDISKFLEPPMDGFAAYEDTSRINGAILVFIKNHPMVKEMMHDFVENFKGTKWGQNGPELVTRVYKKLKVEKPDIVRNVHIGERRSAYPVKWSDYKELFKIPKKENILMEIENFSYGLHLWNKFSIKEGLANGSIIESIMQRNCPQVYERTDFSHPEILEEEKQKSLLVEGSGVRNHIN